MDIIQIDKRLKDLNLDFSYGSEHAAAIDLRACRLNRAEFLATTEIQPGEIFSIGSGIAIDMLTLSNSMCAAILPRSGLGTLGLNLANTIGLIDPDYQGELVMKVKNTGKVGIPINPLDRIAQLVFLPIIRPTFQVVEEFKAKTERGEGGFNSTGVK